MRLAELYLLLLLLVVESHAAKHAASGAGGAAAGARLSSASAQTSSKVHDPKLKLTVLSATLSAPGHADVHILPTIQEVCGRGISRAEYRYTSPEICTFVFGNTLSPEDYNKKAFVVEGQYSCGPNVYTYKFGSPQFSLNCFHTKNIERNIPSEMTIGWYKIVWLLDEFMNGNTSTEQRVEDRASSEDMACSAPVAGDAAARQRHYTRDIATLPVAKSLRKASDSSSLALSSHLRRREGSDTFVSGDGGDFSPPVVADILTSRSRLLALHKLALMRKLRLQQQKDGLQ